MQHILTGCSLFRWMRSIPTGCWPTEACWQVYIARQSPPRLGGGQAIQRSFLQHNVAAGVPTSEIVAELRIAARTVQRYRQNLEVLGSHLAPRLSIGRRPKKIHFTAQEALKELLAANESMYQDEIQIWLSEEWGIDAYRTTVARCLKSMNLTHKKSERLNEGRDDQLRAAWLWKMCYYKASQLVVVDESAASERTKDRRWGWSERGVPCRSI
jgi:transposase